jgi:tetratricopeptide (TPR) repeat protein
MDNELETYRDQLQSNPDDAEALLRLEDALLRHRDFAGVVALYGDRWAALPPDEAVAAWSELAAKLEIHGAEVGEPAVESEIALLVGRIHEEVLGSLEQAMVRYQRAFKLDPQRVDALRAARAIYWQQQNWRLVLQLYSLELQATTEPGRQADLYFEMADVCRSGLNEASDAALCVRSALRIVPDHPRAAAFADLLEAVRGDARARYDALIAQAESTRDPRQRAAFQLQAAELWLKEQPDDPVIEATLRAVIEADPRNEPARIFLEQFYELNGQWESLIKHLEGRVEQTTRKADRLAIVQRLATIARQELQDAEAASRWYREVLALEPVDPEALGFCVDFYSDQERWLDLVAIYEAALRARARAGNESAMLVQIAMILWKKVGDLEQAENYFKRIKLNDPRNVLMLQFYAEYYTAQQDWKKLLATLASRQAIESTNEARIEIGLQMARVAEREIDNAEKAIDIWKSILKLKPDHDVARDALRRLFFQTAKWNALLEFLKEDLNLITGEGEAQTAARVAIYRRMIEIYRDQLSLEVMVVNTYNLVLQVDPTNAEALDALQSRYIESARWNDLIGIYKRRVDAAQLAGDEDGLVALHRQIAQLWIDKFSNPNQAIAHLEAILERRPRDEAAIAQLIDIYRHRKDWRALYQTYRKQLELLEGAARVERLMEMARIAAERLEERDEAIELWRAVIEADEQVVKAWQALEQLYVRTERHFDLAHLFAQQAGRAEDDAGRVAWLKKLGNVYAEKLGDEDRAAETWRAVLRLAPGDLHAENYLRELYLRRGDWSALEGLYGERGDWEGFIRLLSGSAAQAPDVALRVDLYKRMARICRANLHNEAAAVECWERVLTEDPDHVEAARTLAPHYAETGAWDALVAVLEVLLRQHPEDPVALMVDLAQVHELRRGDLPHAFAYYARALEAAPERSDLLFEARRTAALVGNWEGLVELLGALADLHPAAEVEVRMRRVLAEACAEELGRFADAAGHLERIRSLAGDAPEVLDALVALYKRLGQWDELLAVFTRQLELADALPMQSAILAEIGQLHETVRDDADAAQAAWEQLHALDRTNLEAIRGLQRIAERAGDLSAISRWVEAERALTTNVGDVASLLFRLGQLDERRDLAASALSRYAAVLEQAADHLGAVTALERFLETELSAEAARVLEPHMRRSEKWSSLRQVLELQVEGSDDAAFRCRVLREVAELREHQLSDPRGAFQTWQRLLGEDRGDGSVRRELERLAGELGTWEELATLYGGFALGGSDAGPDVPQAAMYSRRYAELLEERLARFADAREMLNRVLGAVGDDLELLDVVDRLTTRLEDWPGLVDVCERKLALLEASNDRVALLFRIGDLMEEVLENPDGVIDAYRRIHEAAPGDERALAALERIYRNTGRFSELADLLTGRLESATPENRVPLTYQLALVLERHLGRTDEALERYAEVLALAPDHDPTVEALEHLLSAHGRPADVALRTRACDVLEPVYVSRDAWHKEIALCRVRLGDAGSPADRVELHTRIARLSETREGSPRTAFGEYAAAFREAYGEVGLLSEMTRLAESLDAWAQLGDVLAQGLEPDRALDLEPALRRDMLARVAEVQEHRVGDLTLAIGYNRRILEEWPDDAAALVNLDRLFERVGDVDALVEVVAIRARLAGTPAESAALAFRLAELQETLLGRADLAIETYVQIHTEITPSDLRAHEALERLYPAVERWSELVAILLDHAERSADVAKKKALSLKAASVTEEQLGRPAEAVQIHRDVLELDPDDTTALAALDRLYGALEAWVDLLEVLERERELATDTGSRDAFEYRIGELLRTHLGEPERSISAFRAVLGRTPGHDPARRSLEALLSVPEVRLTAARILLPIYERAGDWAVLRDVLLGTLQDLDEPAERVATLVRVSELEEQRLEDPAAALIALAEAWRQGEARAEFEPELVRLASLVGAWEALVELLGEGVIIAPARAVVLRSTRAAILRDQIEDAGRAIDEYWEVLLLENENLAALDALEALYEQTGDVGDQIEIIDRKLALTTDLDERKLLLYHIANLFENALADLPSAVSTHRRVLLLDDRDVFALDELERLLSASERWAEVAALYEHRASIAENRVAQAEVEFKLADTCQRFLSEGPRALEIYGGILGDLPGHAATRGALEALFESDDAAAAVGVERTSVGSLLEPVYRAEGDDARLVRVLEVRQANLREDPIERVDVLREIARLQETRLGDAAAAFETCGRVLQVQPEHEENREALRRLAQKAGRFDALASLLRDVIAGLDAVDLKVALLLELGLTEEFQRGQDAAAREVYQQVLSLQPENRAAVGALIDLYSRTAAWDDLVALYLRLSEEAADVEEKKGLLFKVCQLLEDVLDDIPRAIGIWREVLAIENDNAQAFRALERFYTAREAWPELADLLREEIRFATEAAPRAALLHRLGEVLEGRLGDAEGAVEAWQSVLQEEQPEHEPSLGALERMVLELSDKAPDHPLRRKVAEVLEPIYESRGQWPDWIGMLEVQLGYETDRWRRLETLVRIAKTYEEKLSAPAAAFQAFARAFAEDYGNLDLQRDLDRLAESQNAWAQLVEAYLGGIEGYDDLDGATQILLKVARTYDHKLRDAERAIDCYRRVLLIDEANAESLNALERLFAAERRYHDLVTVLSRKADFARDVLEKKELLYRICEIWEDVLDRPDQAIQTYRRVLEEDPEDQNAIEALIRLYERTGNWTLLVEVLREKLEVAADDDERKEILFRIARVCEEQLNDANETILTYRSVLETDARDRRSMEALDRLYSRELRWGELIDLLETERALLAEDKRSAAARRVDALDLRIADVLEHHLGQVEQAIELYGQILARNPDFTDARSALERLLGHERHRLGASRMLEPHYETKGQPELLARVYELQLLDLDDRVERLELLKRLARLRYEVLKHPRSAFESYLRAFQEDPADDEIVNALHDLADELGAHEALAGAYEEQIPAALDAEVSRGLNRRLARLQDAKLSRPDRAIEAWQAVLRGDPYDREALGALDRLYQSRQDWEALIDVLRREIELGSSDDSTDLRFRLGYLLEVVRNEVPQAIELYRSILWERGDHAYALEAMERLAVHLEHRAAIAEVLEPIYRERDAHDKLAILCEMRIELTSDRLEQARLWMASAELRSTRLQDADGALECLLRAFDANPLDEDIRKALVRVATERGAWERLAAAVDAVQPRITDPELRVADLLDVAHWSRGRLRDTFRAAERYVAVLGIDANNSKALDALEEIYTESEVWPRLAEIHRRKAELLYDLDEKRERLRRLAALCAEKLGDVPAAVAAYEEVLALDEADADALRALEDLHELSGNWTALHGVLSRIAESTYDADALAMLHRRMASLARDQLGDRRLAAESLEKVLELAPDDLEAVRTLRAVYEADAAWDRLQDVLVKELTLIETDAERVPLLLALGENADVRLGNPESAIEYYRQVHEIAPGDLGAVGHLERLYAQTARWFDLVDMLRTHVEVLRSQNDDARVVSTLVQIADVAQAHLMDADLAVSALNQVLETDPNHLRALTVLARLHEQSGEWEKCAAALSRAIEHGSPGPERAEALRRLGLLYLDRLDRVEDAKVRLQQAVAEARDGEALAALLRLAEAAGDDREAFGLLGQRRATLEGRDRVPVLLQMATLAEKLGDAASRIGALEEAAVLAPTEAKVNDALLAAYLAEGRFGDAEPVLLRTIERLKGERRFKELFTYNFQMGRVAEEKGDEAAALQYYTECFDYDATYLPNLFRLGKLHFRKENWDKALKIFQTMLLHQMNIESNEQRVDIFFHLGVLRQKLGDPRKAKDMFNRALGYDPEHAPSKAALAGLE